MRVYTMIQPPYKKLKKLVKNFKKKYPPIEK